MKRHQTRHDRTGGFRSSAQSLFDLDVAVRSEVGFDRFLRVDSTQRRVSPRVRANAKKSFGGGEVLEAQNIEESREFGGQMAWARGPNRGQNRGKPGAKRYENGGFGCVFVGVAAADSVGNAGFESRLAARVTVACPSLPRLPHSPRLPSRATRQRRQSRQSRRHRNSCSRGWSECADCSGQQAVRQSLGVRASGDACA